MKNNNRIAMIKIMSDPKYQGKHVILVANKVYTASTGKIANKIVDRLEKKFPNKIPAITYIPDADTLILFGRQKFLETFEVLFSSNHTVSFSVK